MLIEYERCGKVDLRQFYIRRSLRILPVYGAFLLTLYAMQEISTYQQSGCVWIANLTFTTNFLDRDQIENTACGHLWTLAVEEQFYLVWPGLFVALRANGSLAKGICVLVVTLIVAPVSRVIAYLCLADTTLVEQFFGPWSSLLFIDSLGVGCICAFLLAKRFELMNALLTTNSGAAAAMAVMCIALPLVCSRLMIWGKFLVPFGPLIQAFGIGALLIQSILLPSNFFYRLLNVQFVANFGILSYSIYIWHQLFWIDPAILGARDSWWNTFPGWLVPSLLLAVISYYCLERPLFRMRQRAFRS